MKSVQSFDKKEFVDLLNKAVEKNEISNWTIHSDELERSNIYLEKDYKVESILSSKRKDFIFTIYKDYQDEIGVSNFVISESDNLEKFEQELKDAIFICSQSKSKKYELPKFGEDLIDDSNINYDIFYDDKFEEEFHSKSLNVYVAQKIDLFKKLIEENNSSGNFVKLNTIEIFNKISNKSLVTSTGISKSKKSYSTYMEFVLSTKSKDTGEESEHIVYEKINDIYEFDFESFFKESIKYAIDTAKADKAKDMKSNVILSGSACVDFWTPDLTMNSVIGHASARLKFMNISSYDKSKKIIETEYDKLNIYLNPLLEKNNASNPYDEFGISAKRLCIVKDNVFMNFFAGKQFADYLNIKPTGPLGVIEVESGRRSEDELFNDENLVEIVSFSSFVPDLVSGDFSAEIRLGYVIKNGEKIPFKGGLFSGNIFKILEKVELSLEKVEKPGYFGPKTIKFYDCEITGL